MLRYARLGYVRLGWDMLGYKILYYNIGVYSPNTLTAWQPNSYELVIIPLGE